MYVVIMGCGRVGSSVAGRLEQSGHDVAVIDINPDAFRRLGPEFRDPTRAQERQTLIDSYAPCARQPITAPVLIQRANPKQEVKVLILDTPTAGRR